MGARKAYDIAAVVGTYQKNGETKNRYQTVGAVMQKDDGGMFILMERWFNPAGVIFDPSRGDSVLLSIFEPRDDQGKSHQTHMAGHGEVADARPDMERRKWAREGVGSIAHGSGGDIPPF